MKNYKKKLIQPMRPYVAGENMTGISVSDSDTLEEGGMIAVNPANPEDKWYVAKDFFLNNYVEVDGTRPTVACFKAHSTESLQDLVSNNLLESEMNLLDIKYGSYAHSGVIIYTAMIIYDP